MRQHNGIYPYIEYRETFHFHANFANDCCFLTLTLFKMLHRSLSSVIFILSIVDLTPSLSFSPLLSFCSMILLTLLYALLYSLTLSPKNSLSNILMKRMLEFGNGWRFLILCGKRFYGEGMYEWCYMV